MLRRYPFPCLAGNTEHVIEGVVWLEISRQHKMKCSNMRTRIYFRDENDEEAIMNLSRSYLYGAWGKQAYYSIILSFISSYFSRAPSLFFIAGIQHARYSFHTWGLQSPHNLRGLARMIAFLSYPLGFVAWLRDRYRHARKR